VAEVLSPIAPIDQLERHRMELTRFCRRMLGPVDAEDAVQETFVRAWRKFDQFEGRAPLKSWLHSIAANVCAGMLARRTRLAQPLDPTGPPVVDDGRNPPTLAMLDGTALSDGDPAEVTEAREAIRLAFVVVLRHLPPRQRAVLILRVALRWKAAEVAELLDTSVAAVNSALQRARATLAARAPTADAAISLETANAELLGRYVQAFVCSDVDALAELVYEDAHAA
jgi:RNA polymerase sigma-70 factor, ECF subfamily